jgi:hypothetical protein
MISITASIGIFLTSLLVLVRVLIRWASSSTPSDAIQNPVRSGEWSGVCVATLLRVSDDLLGQGAGFWRRVARATLFATLLLGIVWPVAGWLSQTTLGFTDAPWQLFDDAMALLQRVSASQPSQAQIHTWVSAARQGVWRYVYAVGATALIACWGAAAFACAGSLARYLLQEFQASATWAQKSGLFLGLATVTFVLLNVFTFVVGLVMSPAPWVALLLGHAGLGWLVILGLVIAANAFTFYVSDPWLKGVLFVCLFPCLLPLTSAGPALAWDIVRIGFRASREKLLETAQRRLGRAFVPLLMVLIALYVAYWTLSRLL